MKTILMLIVGLSLPGCESIENPVRNRDAVDRSRYLVEHNAMDDMRLPLTINSPSLFVARSRGIILKPRRLTECIFSFVTSLFRVATFRTSSWQPNQD